MEFAHGEFPTLILLSFAYSFYISKFNGFQVMQSIYFFSGKNRHMGSLKVVFPSQHSIFGEHIGLPLQFTGGHDDGVISDSQIWHSLNMA